MMAIFFNNCAQAYICESIILKIRPYITLRLSATTLSYLCLHFMSLSIIKWYTLANCNKQWHNNLIGVPWTYLWRRPLPNFPSRGRRNGGFLKIFSKLPHFFTSLSWTFIFLPQVFINYSLGFLKTLGVLKTRGP